MGKKRTKSRLDSYRIPNTQRVIKPGDTVILRPPDPSTPNYVARIELIEVDSTEKVTLKVRWYYRPEESAGGRRQFHGSKELFLSDHYDFCSPDAIENKCTVHTFKEYTRLDDVRAEDYFCRFDYFATAGTFSPDRVAVYCTCELPYNPDDLMVQCEKCKDWFHPKCVKMTVEEIKGLNNFACPECNAPIHVPQPILPVTAPNVSVRWNIKRPRNRRSISHLGFWRGRAISVGAMTLVVDHLRMGSMVLGVQYTKLYLEIHWWAGNVLVLKEGATSKEGVQMLP